MSATITWSITAMDCYPQAEGQTDVVIVAHWQCSGVQEQDGKTYNGSVYSTCSFNYTGGTFVPYSELTLNDVLGWIWASGVDQAATEAAVNQQIAQQINPSVVQPPLPWVTA
jgi:hypothetical protein